MAQLPMYARLRYELMLDFDHSKQGFVRLVLNPAHPYAANLASRPMPLYVALEAVDSVATQISQYHPNIIDGVCETAQKYYKLGLVLKSLGFSQECTAENPWGTYWLIMRRDTGLTNNYLVHQFGAPLFAALPVGPVSPGVRNYIREREGIERADAEAARIAAERHRMGLLPPAHYGGN